MILIQHSNILMALLISSKVKIFGSLIINCSKWKIQWEKILVAIGCNVKTRSKIHFVTRCPNHVIPTAKISMFLSWVSVFWSLQPIIIIQNNIIFFSQYSMSFLSLLLERFKTYFLGSNSFKICFSKLASVFIWIISESVTLFIDNFWIMKG